MEGVIFVLIGTITILSLTYVFAYGYNFLNKEEKENNKLINKYYHFTLERKMDKNKTITGKDKLLNVYEHRILNVFKDVLKIDNNRFKIHSRVHFEYRWFIELIDIEYNKTIIIDEIVTDVDEFIKVDDCNLNKFITNKYCDVIGKIQYTYDEYVSNNKLLEDKLKYYKLK